MISQRDDLEVSSLPDQRSARHDTRRTSELVAGGDLELWILLTAAAEELFMSRCPVLYGVAACVGVWLSTDALAGWLAGWSTDARDDWRQHAALFEERSSLVMCSSAETQRVTTPPGAHEKRTAVASAANTFVPKKPEELPADRRPGVPHHDSQEETHCAMHAAVHEASREHRLFVLPREREIA